MTINLLRSLSFLIALAAFVYGVVVASHKGGPMYFRIVIGVAVCHLLKELCGTGKPRAAFSDFQQPQPRSASPQLPLPPQITSTMIRTMIHHQPLPKAQIPEELQDINVTYCWVFQRTRWSFHHMRKLPQGS